jgi:hypothetical protein
VISGTPGAAGTISVTISATNAYGTGSATLTLTIGSSGGSNLISNGTYRIEVQSSGLSLASSGTANGSAVQQQTYTAASVQQWTLTNFGSNSVVKLVNVGASAAAEVPGSSTTAGTFLDIASYSGGTNQQWTIASTTTTGYYEIINVNSGLEMNVGYNSMSSGAGICQYTVGGYANGIWTFLSP